jgi:hypothetical protein
MIDYRIPLLDGPFAVIETPSDAPQIIREGHNPTPIAAISKHTEKVYNCSASATAVGLSLNLLDHKRDIQRISRIEHIFFHDY